MNQDTEPRGQARSADPGQIRGSGPAEMPQKNLDVAVVGAGVSGLATVIALCGDPLLKQRIRSITLIDRQANIGGVLCHKRERGYLMEGAAQGVLASRTRFVHLSEQAGLVPRLLASKPRLDRFLVLKKDRGYGIAAIKPSPVAIVRQGILSAWGLVRLLGEFFVPRQTLAVQETLYAFVRRRFGQEAAERLVVPLATGIWAGGAQVLLARHVMPRLVDMEARWGSVLRGAVAGLLGQLRRRMVEGKKATGTALAPRLKGLLSFDGGMTTFAQGLHAHALHCAELDGIRFETRLGLEVQSWTVLSKADPFAARFELRLVRPPRATGSQGQSLAPGETLGTHAFFSSVPLWRDALSFDPPKKTNTTVHPSSSAPDPSLSATPIDAERDAWAAQRFEILRNAPTHGLVVVGIGGTDTKPPPQGFGALAPGSSPDLLGVLYVHSIFPQHAPPGHFLYRVLLGGDRDPSCVTRHETWLTERAKEWLVQLGLLTPDAHVEATAVFKWPSVIPLQDVGQDARLQAMGELERLFPGLFFVGNYRTGVGVYDCLLSAEDGVRRWSAAMAAEASDNPSSSDVRY